MIDGQQQVNTADGLREFPARRHLDCRKDRCRVCLEDHLALDSYIEATSRSFRARHDFLGEYVKWLDGKGIPAETEGGWATDRAWDKENVHAFIADKWGVGVDGF